VQKVVKLGHDFFLEVVISEKGFKVSSVCRHTLMKAEEGMSVIKHSTQTIDLRERCDLPSQSRVRPSHDYQDVPSRLFGNGICSGLEGARKFID
jgi:hypothetical protein